METSKVELLVADNISCKTHCANCDLEIQLDFDKIIKREYYCPDCSIKNDIITECEFCKSELELDANKIESNGFICKECSKKNSLVNRYIVSKISKTESNKLILEKQNLTGIEGLLVIPMIGLIGGIISRIYYLLDSFIKLDILSGVIEANYLSYIIYCVFMFSKKKKIVPILMIIFIIFNTIIGILYNTIIIIRIISLILWVSYFIFSRRVKNTFIN